MDATHGRVRRAYLDQRQSKIKAPLESNLVLFTLYSVRGGHLEAVKYLIEHGADPNITTFGVKSVAGSGSDVDHNTKLEGGGETALWWGKQIHGKHHPVTVFLESIGALDIGPDL